MANCQFSYLSIGERVELTTGHSECVSCGNESPISNKTFWAIYYGHYTDGEVYDKFKVVGYMAVCEGCGQMVRWYCQPCNGDGCWNISEIRNEAEARHGE